ncbi:MAG: hypothetical protein LCH36_06475 [Actinobacteria bacterium]|nr:hypothetical protein [Actinomycetota bacterium]
MVVAILVANSLHGRRKLASAVGSELLTESGTPETISESTFAYDAAGNRAHAESVMGGVTRTVTQKYDDGNRLLSGETGRF